MSRTWQVTLVTHRGISSTMKDLSRDDAIKAAGLAQEDETIATITMKREHCGYV